MQPNNSGSKSKPDAGAEARARWKFQRTSQQQKNSGGKKKAIHDAFILSAKQGERMRRAAAGKGSLESQPGEYDNANGYSRAARIAIEDRNIDREADSWDYGV